jgi:hypothetical protein
MTTTDDRQTAEERIRELAALIRSQPDTSVQAALIEECEALERAIRAFHMEAIRFRMYNVDRLLSRAGAAAAEARTILEDARHHLEAAGFHTRSHQSPA